MRAYFSLTGDLLFVRSGRQGCMHGGGGRRVCDECPVPLVQAVFKAYDKDQSGTISYREFEDISSNFPFIKCFSVLDQDK